jgi:hypothetical protein
MRFIPFAVVLALVAPPSASAAKFPESRYRHDFPYFATPSGRIACDYRKAGGYRVTCTTYEGDPKGQETWCVRSSGRGRFERIQGNFPSEGLARARYGLTYRYHGIKCRIHRTRGIKCSNRGGHGFRVSLQRQTTF